MLHKTFAHHIRCFLVASTTLFLFATASVATAKQDLFSCPPAQNCRIGPPDGQLQSLLNSKGERYWASPCKPNSAPKRLDLICKDIVNCSASRAFGTYLNAQTRNCKDKTFDDYFGLDGLTFGILHFTPNQLPRVFETYKKRNPEKFEAIFGKLNLPMNGSCLDSKWVCETNKTGYFNCNKDFRTAFTQSVIDPDLQKVQLEILIDEYKQRIVRYSKLGLKTEYGLASMAVVSNNLAKGAACKPETWKDQCAGFAKESDMVDCMLEKYVENNCRRSNTKERYNEIQAVYRDKKDLLYTPPNLKNLTSCSTNWGKTSAIIP
jgi:hypothetical protein